MKKTLFLIFLLILGIADVPNCQAQWQGKEALEVEFVDAESGAKVKGALSLRITFTRPGKGPEQFMDDCITASYRLEGMPVGTFVEIVVEGNQTYRNSKGQFVVGSLPTENAVELRLPPKTRQVRGIQVEGRVEWRKRALYSGCADQLIRVVRKSQTKPLAETTTDENGFFSLDFLPNSSGKLDSIFIEVAIGSNEFLPTTMYLDPQRSNDNLVIRLKPQYEPVKVNVCVLDGALHKELQGVYVRVESEEEIVAEGVTAVDGRFVVEGKLPFDIDSLHYSIFKSGYTTVEMDYPVAARPVIEIFSDSIALDGQLLLRGRVLPRVTLHGDRFRTQWTQSNSSGIYRFMVSRATLLNAGRLKIEAYDGDRAGAAVVDASAVVRSNRYQVDTVIDPRSEVGLWSNHLVLGFGCAGVQRSPYLNVENANGFVELLVARKAWKNWYLGARFGLGRIQYADTIMRLEQYRSHADTLLNYPVVEILQRYDTLIPLSVVVKYAYGIKEFPWMRIICGAAISMRSQSGMVGIAFLPGRRLQVEFFANTTLFNFRPWHGIFRDTAPADLVRLERTILGKAFWGTIISIRL